MSVARVRFDYGVNIAVLCAPFLLYLLSPTTASQQLWGSAGGLPYSQFVGAWWAAVAALSVLGLRSPLKYRCDTAAAVLHASTDAAACD